MACREVRYSIAIEDGTRDRVHGSFIWLLIDSVVA